MISRAEGREAGTLVLVEEVLQRARRGGLTAVEIVARIRSAKERRRLDEVRAALRILECQGKAQWRSDGPKRRWEAAR